MFGIPSIHGFMKFFKENFYINITKREKMDKNEIK